eukprot:GGOE01028773.1.p1 GENE.GGOE01028773.1~~GGOE01028773.1.p1  ORF type:complete len:371 (-),score=84.67 GGOE01028773.1:979-1941(-)
MADFVELLNRLLETFNASTVSVSEIETNVQDALQLLHNFYLFVLLPICVATLLITVFALLFLIPRRRSPKCTFVLALIALVVNMGVWAILGVLFIGLKVASDLHDDFIFVLNSFRSSLTHTYDAAQSYIVCNTTCSGNCSIEVCFCDCLGVYFGNQSSAYTECMALRTPLHDTLNSTQFSSCIPFQVAFLSVLSQHTSAILSGYRVLTAAVTCMGVAGTLIVICLVVFTEWFLGGKHFRNKLATAEDVMDATKEKETETKSGREEIKDGTAKATDATQETESAHPCEVMVDMITPTPTPAPLTPSYSACSNGPHPYVRDP